MGTGNYRHADGKTVILSLYDGFDEEGDEALYSILAQEAFSDFQTALEDILAPTSFEMDGSHWRSGERDALILAENELYQLWSVEDSYGHTFLTYGISQDIPDGMDGLARAWLEERANKVFDQLQALYPLRVATCAWTSAERSLATVSAEQATATRAA